MNYLSGYLLICTQNVCFGGEIRELFIWVPSNVYPQYMFWWRNKRTIYRHSGSVVERLLCDREVVGSIPGRVIPKTLKMVLAALLLGAQQ